MGNSQLYGRASCGTLVEMEPTKRHAWEHLTEDEVRRTLAANYEDGLTTEEVVRRKEIYGANILKEGEQASLLEKAMRQFKNPLVFILCGAGMVTFGLQEFLDTIVILIAVVINVIVGTFQEERASKAFEKLSKSIERHALVLRDGKKENILTENLVPGDIIFLEGGFYVPADARILQAKDLKINEAALTGEWMSVKKEPGQIIAEKPLAERHNMVWMGTLIESGQGKAVVAATGSKTQVGAIAEELGTIDEHITPLQENIKRVARFLSYVVAFALVVIFALGIIRGEELGEMLLIAIAVAVATIPSGLPAAVTVVLALGMEAILKRGGLVRSLVAAETLGSTTVILTDKTGTLTQAKMKLVSLHTIEAIHKERHDIEGPDNRFLLELGVSASDAFIEETEDAPGKITVHGRPIEKALAVAGIEAGIVQEEYFKTCPRIDYLQFASERRFGASLHAVENRKTKRLVITGAPETLLEAATSIYRNGKKVKITHKEIEQIRNEQERMSSEGVRVIAAGYRDVAWDEIPTDTGNDAVLIESLTFVGLVAFADPVREDVHDSIAEVKGAGAEVIMITGDNPATARNIARQVGIVVEGDELVVEGREIDEWADDELLAKLREVRVIARALPSHKLRIARLLRNNGEVVAMTGDGINDAPALRAASIGVAVGSGTEVAKEASDIVLINNSFSIIVDAIREGRRIIDNLKKIVAYLLSTSFSEIFVIGGALLAGAPLPLLPVHILAANIIEEGFMSFSFAFEKGGKNIMKRNPRSAESKRIMTGDLVRLIVIVSTVTGLLGVSMYFLLLSLGLPIEEVRTLMFAILSLDAIFFTFSLKSLDTPVWRIDVFSNMYLLCALSTSIVLLISTLSIPLLQKTLQLVPLNPLEILLLVGVGIFNLATIELAKYVFFGRKAAKEIEAAQNN